MKKRISIMIISVILAVLFMSGGYGYWRKDVSVIGNIRVLEAEVQEISSRDGGVSEGENKIEFSKEESISDVENSQEIDTNADIDKDTKISDREDSNGKISAEEVNKETSHETNDRVETIDTTSPVNLTNTTDSSITNSPTNTATTSSTESSIESNSGSSDSSRDSNSSNDSGGGEE